MKSKTPIIKVKLMVPTKSQSLQETPQSKSKKGTKRTFKQTDQGPFMLYQKEIMPWKSVDKQSKNLLKYKVNNPKKDIHKKTRNEENFITTQHVARAMSPYRAQYEKNLPITRKFHTGLSPSERLKTFSPPKLGREDKILEIVTVDKQILRKQLFHSEKKQSMNKSYNSSSYGQYMQTDSGIYQSTTQSDSKRPQSSNVYGAKPKHSYNKTQFYMNSQNSTMNSTKGMRSFNSSTQSISQQQTTCSSVQKGGNNFIEINKKKANYMNSNAKVRPGRQLTESQGNLSPKSFNRLEEDSNATPKMTSQSQQFSSLFMINNKLENSLNYQYNNNNNNNNSHSNQMSLQQSQQSFNHAHRSNNLNLSQSQQILRNSQTIKQKYKECKQGLQEDLEDQAKKLKELNGEVKNLTDEKMELIKKITNYKRDIQREKWRIYKLKEDQTHNQIMTDKELHDQYKMKDDSQIRSVTTSQTTTEIAQLQYELSQMAKKNQEIMDQTKKEKELVADCQDQIFDDRTNILNIGKDNDDLRSTIHQKGRLMQGLENKFLDYNNRQNNFLYKVAVGAGPAAESLNSLEPKSNENLQNREDEMDNSFEQRTEKMYQLQQQEQQDAIKVHDENSQSQQPLSPVYETPKNNQVNAYNKGDTVKSQNSNDNYYQDTNASSAHQLTAQQERKKSPEQKILENNFVEAK